MYHGRVAGRTSFGRAQIFSAVEGSLLHRFVLDGIPDAPAGSVFQKGRALRIDMTLPDRPVDGGVVSARTLPGYVSVYFRYP